MKNKLLTSKCLAFLCNIVIILLPILVWDIIVLFVLAGILPAGMLDVVDPFVEILMIVSLLLTNVFIAVSYGQTFGAVSFDIRVVDLSKKKASRLQCMLRELIGFSLPFFILYWLFNYIGIVAYLLVNLLVILIDPYGRSIVDYITHTRTISAYDAGAPVKKKIAKKNEVEEVKEVVKPQPAAAPAPAVHDVRDGVYKVDLHMHSRYSDDGDFSVEELFAMAKRNGIQTISIADHNSIKANFEAAILADRYQINYIPGIEMDCSFHGTNLHLLGYGIDYKDERYIQLSNYHLKQERKASIERVDKFEAVTGLKLDVDLLLSMNNAGIITGEMIGEQLLNNPAYADEELLKPYRVGGERNDNPYVNFYWDFFAQGKPAYVDIAYPTMQDMVELIKDTGGIPILAHPKKPFGCDSETLKAILDCGVRGLEVFSSYHSPEEIACYLQIVKETSCLVTCGSDFHGKTKPSIAMGVSGAEPKYDKLISIFTKKFIDA
ncbi:PHP domain-containing protein [Dielma fastidiosa]|uniref:PHP domain-containing protein n=1 Tax=Dielma fastidiosa TaxID=1034346 RepID=UPI0023F36D50|nr:PHP domain-containing protein [Dielma fastidiosa]